MISACRLRSSLCSFCWFWSFFSFIAFAVIINASASLAQTVPVNDQALFLAGLPVQSSPALKKLQSEDAWKQYANVMNRSRQQLQDNRLRVMKNWQDKELKRQLPRYDALFYMFSGPDLITADTLFPDASTYILCGLEPLGKIPSPDSIRSQDLRPALMHLSVALKSIINLSFFRTLDMQTDLKKGEFSGVLPVLYIFLAWNGNYIEKSSYVVLDENGVLTEAEGQMDPARKITGLRITFRKDGESRLRDAYYFKTNLSDSGIEKNDGLLKFMSSYGNGASYLKAASYLMHKNYFSKIRNFLLENSKALLEDDSGIPLKFFNSDKWKLTYYGSYVGVIDLFKEHYQAVLRKAYAETNAVKGLPFITGYTYLHKANMLLAVLKEDAVSRDHAGYTVGSKETAASRQ